MTLAPSSIQCGNASTDFCEPAWWVLHGEISSRPCSIRSITRPKSRAVGLGLLSRVISRRSNSGSWKVTSPLEIRQRPAFRPNRYS